MRAAAIALALLSTAASASAQLTSGAYWESAGLRGDGGARLISGATITPGTRTLTSAVLTGSVAVRVSDLAFGLHAGTLRDPRGVTSGGATISALYQLRRTRLELRAGAAAAPDEQSGASVTTVGAALARAGVSLSFRASVLPPTPSQTRQVLVTERDTTYFLNHIEPGQPRRVYNDVELAYRHALSRFVVEAGAGARFGGRGAVWGRAGATYQLSSTIAVGGSIERDPGTPWLGTDVRNAGTFFIRMDPPRRHRADPVIPVAIRAQPLRITTRGVTTFAIAARGAKRIEITGTFSDWQPVALLRDAAGVWSVSLPLERGVYHIALRIDGGAWRAPPGVATVPDEFGGETGVFEVR